MLKIENLNIGYKQKKVAEAITAELYPGELIALLGPNGTGKSTLLKTVAGIVSRLSGHIFFDEKDISRLSPREKAKEISIVLTEPIGIGNFSVTEILQLGRYPYKGWWGRSEVNDERIIRNALESTKIAHLANRQLAELSDGEKQKVMIARALAQDTDYILLDEPTSHLDLPSKIEVMALLKELAHQWRKAILVSTHDLNLAIQAADKFWLINKKGEFQRGTNEDLILTGALNNCFELSAHQYNFATGKISFPQKNNLLVTVKGKGQEYVWTKHALGRLGYNAVDNAELVVFAHGSRQWSVQQGSHYFEFSSIEELLRQVKTFEANTLKNTDQNN